MNLQMKRIVFSLALTLVTALTAAAQQQVPPPSSQDLPSAPSAVIAPKPQPKPPAQTSKTGSSGAPSPATTSGTPAPAAPASEPQASAQPAAAVSPAAEKDLTTDDDNKPLETIKANVDEVNVIFTVTDKHGKFIKDLTKKDFEVFDDNRPVQKIVSFSSQTDLPLRVGLLIDSSNSIRDRFRFEQEAAIEFLNQIIRPRSDRAFVIGFDTTAEVTQDFTDDTDLLSKGVRMLRPGGGTALYDAIYYACRDKLLKERSNVPTRRAIILLSDGDDNQSRVSREEAIEMAQRAEVIVYTISTNISGVKLRGDKILERIADATGGRAFFPFKIQDVANAFSEIQDELRSQYALAYRPPDFKADGSYRSINIVAENHKSLKVRARKGYYAPSR